MAETPAPRIGVYICQCGGNISDVVDVERVAQQAATLPNVAVVRTNTFMCSDPGQNLIAQDIENEGLDRVVVAACSPKLHETTFRSVLNRSGLSPYLYEHANIREQVSWATDDGEQATTKATSLVAAAVAKASHLAPLEPIRVETTARAAVIGAGVAGLRAARDLAQAGIEVALIERQAFLGGNVATLDLLFPNEEPAADVVTRLAAQVVSDPLVTIYTQAAVEKANGYVGNFAVTVRQEPGGRVVDAAARSGAGPGGTYRPFEGYVLDDAAADAETPGSPGGDASPESEPQASSADDDSAGDGRRLTIDVGAVVVATGFEPYVPGKGEYGFGRLPQVITLPDFIKWLNEVDAGAGLPEMDGRQIGSVAFIHCVGSRQAEGTNKPQADGKINEYCSRTCCTATLQALCDLHAKCPDVALFDFYQDIRAYGRGHEDYYEKASKSDVVFVRWDAESPPSVVKAPEGDTAPVLVALPGRPHLG